MKTFLLRFEEQVGSEHSAGTDNRSPSSSKSTDRSQTLSKIIAGTKTLTEVRREGVDDDPGTRSLFAFPN